jgi:hypothetical protein
MTMPAVQATFYHLSYRGQRGHVRPLFWEGFAGQTPFGAFPRSAAPSGRAGRAVVDNLFPAQAYQKDKRGR